MRRRLLRLFVLVVAMAVLWWGPANSRAQSPSTECSFLNVYCNGSDWCDRWWLIPLLPFTWWETQFCCDWDGTNLECWTRSISLDSCCRGGMIDPWGDEDEDGDGDGEEGLR